MLHAKQWMAWIGTALLMVAGNFVGAADLQLPVAGTAERPLVLLQAEPEKGAVPENVTAFGGEVVAKTGADYVAAQGDQVVAAHKGFGSWGVNFRYALTPSVPAGEYTFWARWRQGGDPKVCAQTFVVLAGPDAEKLQERGKFRLTNKDGWKPAWISANTALKLLDGDRVLEIRNTGQGQDAKGFDAFLLSSGLAAPAPQPAAKENGADATKSSTNDLPVTGTAEQPVVLLAFGKEPLRKPGQDPAIQVFTGRIIDKPGADSAGIGRNEAIVSHKGFGDWGATFQFDLNSAVTPGYYSFDTRYRSGGEVSQVLQTFVVKAGPDEQNLGVRGVFQTVNRSPWQFQWVSGKGNVTIFPGDKLVQVVNSGRADGAKMFNAFALKLQKRFPDWLTAEDAVLRNRFLAQLAEVKKPEKYLYVIDGPGEGGKALFEGLALETNKPWYATAQVKYLLGEEADAMAKQLGVRQLPAAIVADSFFAMQGMLATPPSPDRVADFLNRPSENGIFPAPPAVASDTPQPLRNGVPEAWLIGGITDGKAGLSIYGLDSETVMRPTPDNAYLESRMMGGSIKTWGKVGAAANGNVIIDASTHHSYGWSRGTGYGQLYLRVDQQAQVTLHLRQSGVRTSIWLDGRPMTSSNDPNPPADFPKPGDRPQKSLEGLTTEGLVMTALSEKSEPAQAVRLDLSPGWHSLLVKMVMQHDKAETFFFAAKFTDADGKPVEGIVTQTTDPTADLALNAVAAKFRPLIYADAPGNLPRPGEQLKVRADIGWHPILEERALAAPLIPFQAKLKLRLTDFNGKEVAVREVEGKFPGQVSVDFGPAPQTGYYAVYPSLHAPDGKLIAAYWADGFTVVPGNVAQKERLDKKKLWNNYYYAFDSGDRGFPQKGDFFNWLERSGIWQNLGSIPGSVKPQDLSPWSEAKSRGMVFFADTAGDSPWLNDAQPALEAYVQAVAPYTRYFKCVNEIDIRQNEPSFDKVRDPAHWVERAKREYQTIHAARSDALYIGGSIVRPGDMRPGPRGVPGSGQWFLECLKLGLDQYHDAWDVHAYPQTAPRFDGPFGNSANDDERGVLAAYKSIGRENKLPFFQGECAAKAAHSQTGRRGQAEVAAKMIAWINSRSDYLGLAFCIGHEYDWAYGRLWDYSMGHKPGEAAMITAGALIDGLPYKAVDTGSADIQAAWFGDTFMIWRADEQQTAYQLALPGAGPWVIVNVVGAMQPLETRDGKAELPISTSPVYVLTQSEYERLTRSQ